VPLGTPPHVLRHLSTARGPLSFIKDPEIDQWFEQQSIERDRKKREAILHKIQQKVYDEAYLMPLWELGFLCASGPRVAVSGLGLIPLTCLLSPLRRCAVEVLGEKTESLSLAGGERTHYASIHSDAAVLRVYLPGALEHHLFLP
jgi:hypothetical protein